MAEQSQSLLDEQKSEHARRFQLVVNNFNTITEELFPQTLPSEKETKDNDGVYTCTNLFQSFIYYTPKHTIQQQVINNMFREVRKVRIENKNPNEAVEHLVHELRESYLPYLTLSTMLKELSRLQKKPSEKYDLQVWLVFLKNKLLDELQKPGTDMNMLLPLIYLLTYRNIKDSSVQDALNNIVSPKDQPLFLKLVESTAPKYRTILQEKYPHLLKK